MSIENEIKNLLDNESKRIMNILIDMYNKKTKVNKAFPYVVADLMKKEFEPYEATIINKTVSLIPIDLMICPKNEWVFVTEREYHCFIEEEKFNKIETALDNKEFIQKISRNIIADYKSNNLYKKNILEIISNYIPQKEFLNMDSDLVTCIIEEIVNDIRKTYQVSSITPFIIKGI